MSNEPTPINTIISDAPQLQTVMQDGLPPISSIVNAPWVSVTSVNGMTGDVSVELVLDTFQPNHYYPQNTAILYQGSLYYAKANFTSGTSFNSADWGAPEFNQVQADWNVTETSSNAYIKNKPTQLSQFSNDSNFATQTEVNQSIETATDPIFEEVDTLSTNVGELSSSVSSLSGTVNGLNTTVTSLAGALDNKVDKEVGKGLSSNDFTSAYKELLDGLKNEVLNQLYPVGTIYQSTTLSTATQVATALGGGTWEAYGQGRVLVGKATSGTFGTIGATGGETTHTLTIDEIPSHNHVAIRGNTSETASGSGWGGVDQFVRSSADSYYRAVDTSSTGGGGAHNNLQPYIVVYIWRRTA